MMMIIVITDNIIKSDDNSYKNNNNINNDQANTYCPNIKIRSTGKSQLAVLIQDLVKNIKQSNFLSSTD